MPALVAGIEHRLWISTCTCFSTIRACLRAKIHGSLTAKQPSPLRFGG